MIKCDLRYIFSSHLQSRNEHWFAAYPAFFIHIQMQPLHMGRYYQILRLRVSSLSAKFTELLSFSHTDTAVAQFI